MPRMSAAPSGLAAATMRSSSAAAIARRIPVNGTALAIVRPMPPCMNARLVMLVLIIPSLD
jgi:hypothetical protein